MNKLISRLLVLSTLVSTAVVPLKTEAKTLQPNDGTLLATQSQPFQFEQQYQRRGYIAFFKKAFRKLRQQTMP
jgi:hypothetical protein